MGRAGSSASPGGQSGGGSAAASPSRSGLSAHARSPQTPPAALPPRTLPARPGAGGRPAGSLTGLRRAAQRSGQAAGAPPAALQQHGRHGGARRAAGRLRHRSCPAARAAAIPTRPAAPGSRVRPAPPRGAGHAGSRSPGVHGESGGDGVSEGRARTRLFPAAAEGSGGACGGYRGMSRCRGFFPGTHGHRHAGKATGRARCEGRAPVPRITPAQSAALQHRTVLSCLARVGLDDAQRARPALTAP